MTLMNHSNITNECPSDLIDEVIKGMRDNLAKALIDKIEPGKDYLIKLHGADCFEDPSTASRGYKMAIEVEGWIPCSERLPKMGEKVLVSTANTCFTQVFKGYYNKYPEDWVWENNRIKRVLAWMPLPEPYKEK